MLQMTVFLSMLNNRVGLTVANLFVIDQNVILSVSIDVFDRLFKF